MKTKIISLLLCALMLLPGSYAYAAELPSTDNTDSELMQDAVDTLEEFGYEIIDVDAVGDDQEFIEVDSIEELEDYLNTLEEVDKEYSAEIQPYNPLSRANGAKTVSWYSPFSGFDGLTLLCWSNVDFSYNYKYVNSRPQYTSIKKISSYLTGISMTSWHQTSYSTSFSKKYSTKDTCIAKVNGYYLLGVSIGGQPIGASRKSTWTAKLTLVP